MLPGRTYTPLDFARMAQRRAPIIVAGLLVGAYAALVASSRIRDVFQSEMLIQVVPQRVPDSYVQSTVTMRTEDRLNALSQQVLSRTALEGIINEMNLYRDLRAIRPMQDVVELMRKDTVVEPVASAGVGSARGSDAFYVRFSYSDRDLATRVTERLGGLFIDLNAKDRGQLAQATSEFLESQLTQTRNQLEEQERRLEQFRQRNAGRLPNQLDFNMQAIQSTQLQIQALVESLARDRDRKLMLQRLNSDAQAESAKATPRPLALADGKPGEGQTASSVLTTEEQLAAAREALARLRLRLTPEHPDVARAQRVLGELERRAAAERQTRASAPSDASLPDTATAEETARRQRIREARAEVESLERQIQFKEQQEQRLRDTLASYQHRIEAIPGVESEWTALTRDYETTQAAYKDLLTKSEQSKVSVELERRQIGEQFRVLDPARPPVRPRGLKRAQINGAGALAGLLLGLAIAALIEFRDQTFETVTDVVEVLNLPVVAQVPYVKLDVDRQRERRSRWLGALAVGVAALCAVIGFWALELWKYVA